jgi:hypothetical protein
MILIRAREHRGPYLFLFPALVLSALGNAAGVALEHNNLPVQFNLPLATVLWLFTNWLILLLLLSIVAVLLNRQAAIYAATEGMAGRNLHGFTVGYGILAVMLFVLGTAGPILQFATISQYQTVFNQINFEFNANASLEKAELDVWRDHQSHLWSDIDDGFDAFVVLAGFVVIISTALLRRAGCAAGIKDKVLDLCTVTRYFLS